MDGSPSARPRPTLFHLLGQAPEVFAYRQKVLARHADGAVFVAPPPSDSAMTAMRRDSFSMP